jgi:hypothetical protein
MEVTSLLLQLTAVIAMGVSLSWLKALADHIVKLRQQITSQDRPQCHFNPAYKRSKVETRTTPKPREHDKENSNRQAPKGSSPVEASGSDRV